MQSLSQLLPNKLGQTRYLLGWARPYPAHDLTQDWLIGPLIAASPGSNSAPSSNVSRSHPPGWINPTSISSSARESLTPTRSSRGVPQPLTLSIHP